MAPRYAVRAQPGNGRYCVWDQEKNAVATSPNGLRQHADLRLEEAFQVIDQLTGEQETDNQA